VRLEEIMRERLEVERVEALRAVKEQNMAVSSSNELRKRLRSIHAHGWTRWQSPALPRES
jgi:hypothetical protein